MSYKSMFGKSIKQAFNTFHDENPLIYRKFSLMAFEAIEAGKKKISSKMIINVIRWNYFIETKSEDGFKINDAFTAHYARQFIKDYPDHKDVFEFRKLRSVDEWSENTELNSEGQFELTIN